MNGSTLPILSMLLQAITSMMTLANNNMVAPFSWAMERSHPLSPLLAPTLWTGMLDLVCPLWPDRNHYTHYQHLLPQQLLLIQTNSIWA